MNILKLLWLVGFRVKSLVGALVVDGEIDGSLQLARVLALVVVYLVFSGGNDAVVAH